MKRREFITALGGVAVWPTVVLAQARGHFELGLLGTTAFDEYANSSTSCATGCEI